MYLKLFRKIIKREKASLVIEGVVLFPLLLMITIAFIALIQINTLSTYFRHKAEVATLEIIAFNIVGDELLDDSILLGIDKTLSISQAKFRKDLLNMPFIKNENLEVILDLRGHRIQIYISYNMPFLFNQSYKIEERIVRERW